MNLFFILAKQRKEETDIKSKRETTENNNFSGGRASSHRAR